MPPRAALLTISMARQAALGKKTFRVVEPDEYDRITTLSANDEMFAFFSHDPGEEKAGSFFTLSDKDTTARSGSNESEYWLANDALVKWLKRQLARENQFKKKLRKSLKSPKSQKKIN